MKETFNINVERENKIIKMEMDDDDGVHTNQKDISKKIVGQKHTHHF